MLNLAVMLEESARQLPDRIPLIFNETKLSYAAVNAAADQVANGLAEPGIGPSERLRSPARPALFPDHLLRYPQDRRYGCSVERAAP